MNAVDLLSAASLLGAAPSWNDLTEWFRGQLLVLLVVLTVVLAVAMWVVPKLVKSLREQINGDGTAPSELLTNFREMHQQGDLSDTEFRTIKTVLGAKLRNGAPNESKPNEKSK